VWYELGFYIPGDGILHCHRREQLRSYLVLTGWVYSGEVICLLRSTNWTFISQKTAFFSHRREILKFYKIPLSSSALGSLCFVSKECRCHFNVISKSVRDSIKGISTLFAAKCNSMDKSLQAGNMKVTKGLSWLHCSKAMGRGRNCSGWK
jgi:hypothetical protein